MIFVRKEGWRIRGIPYNNETKDLLRTTGNAPEKYKTW